MNKSSSSIEAKLLWIENLPLYTKLPTNVRQVNLFEGLAEWFFEHFFHESLDQNLIVVKSTVTTTCDSDYCPKFLQSSNVLSSSNYFEAYLKYWQDPYITTCGSEIKTVNGKEPKGIPANAFKIKNQILAETGTSRINILNEGIYHQSKDLSTEINFPLYQVITQRYHLTGVSYCNSNHHIADIWFENVKNVGWYQYDGLEKTYRARAKYIGNIPPPLRDSYAMDYIIYVRI
ncbi:5846_t:CDS:2 [Gigaspora margarita]|uniref:5846_t:CDS:1 n=1 Tax=Gigaspora margarita TaxID=4874 RepID=A0ABN7VDI9_GIGMA|nr:5846_t:CDS:2 [Gigaspora margarita]